MSKKRMPTQHEILKFNSMTSALDREAEEEEADRRRIETEVLLAKRQYGRTAKGRKKLFEGWQEVPADIVEKCQLILNRGTITSGKKLEECEVDIYQVIEGDVLDVIGHTDPGCRPSMGSGYIPNERAPSSNLEIKIKSNSPVKTLIFRDGLPPIKKGQHIMAAIYMIEHSGGGPLPIFRHYKNGLKERESASAIKIMEKGEVIATYQNL